MNKRIISLFMALVLTVALAPAYTFAASSGSTWSKQTNSSQNGLVGIAYAGDLNKYVAVAGDLGTMHSSIDGAANFTLKNPWGPTTNIDHYLRAISYGNNTFVAVGYLFNGNTDAMANQYLISADGSSWTKGSFTGTDLTDSTGQLSVYGVGFGGSTFVAVGSNGLIVTSSNGTAWSQTAPGAGLSTKDLRGVSYGGSTFVTVGASGAIETSSNNGANWLNKTNNVVGTSALQAVSYGNSTFVAVGDGGKIFTSSDNGANWNSQVSGTLANLKSVSFGNGSFVAVGNAGTILTSSDNGATWSARTSSVTNDNLTGVIYDGNNFVAVGASGTIIKSSLGVIYNGNGNTGGNVPSDSNAYIQGATATVLGNTGSLVKSNSTFAGWNTAANGSGTDKAAGSSVTIGSSDTILYAKWTATSTSSSPTPTPVATATPTPGPVTPISLDATKYNLGAGGTHTTVVYNNKNDNSSTIIAASSITFTSSLPAVATVDANGVVTALGKGTTTISAYYAAGNNTRYATVTVDAKPAVYLAADDKKTGAVTLSVYGPTGTPVENAVVKISSGAIVYPLTSTNNAGKVTAYVPAGTFNVLVYTLNGTTLKNYSFMSLKVMAGQASSPLVQPQLTAGSIDLSVDAIKGADKKITGTTFAGATVTLRDGAATIGTAKADAKLGKFSIILKTPQPGKTLTVTAIDADENEKTVSVQVPLVTAVALTAATKDNDVDHDIAITFKDTVNLLVNTVTSVTYNGNALTKTTDYTLTAGKLTIKKGVIQAVGSHTIVVKSSAYEDATVTQLVKAGTPDDTKTTYTLSGTLAVGQTATATVTVKDIYGNLAEGKQVYADITFTNSTKTTAERYSVGKCMSGYALDGT